MNDDQKLGPNDPEKDPTIEQPPVDSHDDDNEADDGDLEEDDEGDTVPKDVEAGSDADSQSSVDKRAHQ